jgi:SMP-30/Gluconolactonase/LRE-like region
LGCEGCLNRASPDEDNPLTREWEELMRIEVMIDVKAVLGEGPLWDVDEQRLYFIDSFGCNVFRCTADGCEVRAWDVPVKIGSMALRRQGGAVLSLANGFHFLDFKTGECQLIVDPEPDKPANRINDGKADKRGRFVAGSMDTMEEGPMARSIVWTPSSRSTSSTTASSSPTVRAGVPTDAPSISPTVGRAKSGPTTTTSTRAPFPIGARSAK